MATEIFMGLLFLGIVFAVVVAPIAMAIVALNRSRRIDELLNRVTAIERQLRQFRTGPPVDIHAPAPATEERPDFAPPVVPASEEIPSVLPARRQPTTTAPINWEAWIGGRAFGWIAVILLVFAVGFFLRHAFEHGWIGPLGRVAIGLLLGLALCAGGLRFHRRGWRIFGQFLTSAGIVLLYLSTYASFGYYSLIPQDHAGIFLVVIIAEAAILALLYEAAGRRHHGGHWWPADANTVADRSRPISKSVHLPRAARRRFRCPDAVSRLARSRQHGFARHPTLVLGLVLRALPSRKTPSSVVLSSRHLCGISDAHGSCAFLASSAGQLRRLGTTDRQRVSVLSRAVRPCVSRLHRLARHHRDGPGGLSTRC